MSQRVYLVSQQLIANNIELISATSWAGYQEKGRGVVLIEGGTGDNLPTVGTGPLVYVSDKETQETEEGWPIEDLASLVKIYNPDSEVVVLVKWRGELGIYRFKPPTPPPLAYESLKKTLPSL